MEQEQLLNLQNMEVANAQDHQLPHRDATPRIAQDPAQKGTLSSLVMFLVGAPYQDGTARQLWKIVLQSVTRMTDAVLLSGPRPRSSAT